MCSKGRASTVVATKGSFGREPPRSSACNEAVRLRAVLRFDLTPDAHLRLWETADVPELHALIGANREHLAPWMAWVDQRLEDTARFVAGTRHAIADGSGLQTALVERGRIVGSVGTHVVDWANGSTTLGYWLAADATGRGLMTRAVAAYVDHCFGPWHLQRIEIRCATANAASRAIPERLGFAHEGTARRAMRVGDAWQDLEVYALLAP